MAGSGLSASEEQTRVNGHAITSGFRLPLTPGGNSETESRFVKADVHRRDERGGVDVDDTLTLRRSQSAVL